jgi:predicted Zn-dependent protease
VYSQGDDVDHAEADYRRALDIDPEDQASRLALAELLLDKRQNGREAAENFERLWSVRRDAAVALGLAQSWRQLGRGEEARRLLDEWLAAHPDDGPALAERGRLAMDSHATEEAVGFLRRAVARSPYSTDAEYTLYLCLGRLGRAAEAEEVRAHMEQTKEETKKARQRLVELTGQLQKSPDSPDLRCDIAEVFLRYGPEEEGLRWLLTTIQNHPRHRRSHLALAKYYEKQGQAARAGEHKRLAETAQ